MKDRQPARLHALVLHFDDNVGAVTPAPPKLRQGAGRQPRAMHLHHMKLLGTCRPMQSLYCCRHADHVTLMMLPWLYARGLSQCTGQGATFVVCSLHARGSRRQGFACLRDGRRRQALRLDVRKRVADGQARAVHRPQAPSRALQQVPRNILPLMSYC